MRFWLFTILLFSVLRVYPAFADETDQNWDTILYNSDTNGFNKPVTQKEFDDALNKVKKVKKIKNIDKEPSIDKNVINTDINAGFSEDYVLRIYNDVFYKDSIVKSGFYKVKSCSEDKNDFIELSQGGKPVTRIKATKVRQSSFCQDNVKCIKTELLEDKYLKVFYKDLNTALVGYLYILKNK